MRGQMQAGSARLGTLPIRARWATWAQARVRKRSDARAERLVVMARCHSERRQALRAGSSPPVALHRLPY